MKKILVALLVLGLAAPAMAADFDFYGSFRTHLGYYDVDQQTDVFKIGPGVDPSVGHGYDDDSGTVLSIGGNSTFGANISVSENVYGKVETGLSEGGYPYTSAGITETEEVYLRQMFGVWDFGGGKLLAGKTYTPGELLGYSKLSGNIGSVYDCTMLTAGLPYIGRKPMVQLSFGNFDIAAIEANTGAQASYYATSIPDAANLDEDFVLPRMEAGYTFNMDNITLRPVAGFQTFDLEGYDAAGDKDGSETIQSYHVGLGVKADFDPAYVNATMSYHQNPGNYGEIDKLNSAVTYAQYVDGDFEDATTMQGLLVAGFKVSPMVNLEAGLGYMSGEADTAVNQTAEQTAMMYYGQAWLTMTENVHIIPEIGVLDIGDLEYDNQDDVEGGKMSYFDVSFRYEF